MRRKPEKKGRGGGRGGKALPYGDERGASDRSTLPLCVISIFTITVQISAR